MSTRAVARVAALLAIVAAASGDARAGSQNTPAVYLAHVDSIIHPVSAEYMVKAIDAADSAGAALLVFTLDTPGGLVDSTRAIVARMLSAKTPIAVYVTPSGARAASAGFILLLAADVAAMAPGTHTGAAHPVSAGGGQQPDETSAAKAAADTAAYVRTLASGRSRNVELAEAAVHESRAFTEQEARRAVPPLVDLIAADVFDLLRQLDGRSVRRFDGSTVTLSTAQSVQIPIEMTTRQRVLSAIAHPNIAFILLSLGLLGLTVELWSPGAIFPGVVGAVSLILAFFALQLLPVNYAGLLLIALGIALLLLEVKIASYGLLTVGGIICLVLGGMILVDAPEPDIQLSLRFLLPVVLGFAGVAAFLVRIGARAQRLPASTGASLLVGLRGEALSDLGPGRTGQVRLQGEIWRAASADAIPAGTLVVVTAVQGLTLTVRPA